MFGKDKDGKFMSNLITETLFHYRPIPLLLASIDIKNTNYLLRHTAICKNKTNKSFGGRGGAGGGASHKVYNYWQKRHSHKH